MILLFCVQIWTDFALTRGPTLSPHPSLISVSVWQWDEWISIDSPCLAPAGTRTYQEGGPLRMGHRVEVLDEADQVRAKEATEKIIFCEFMHWLFSKIALAGCTLCIGIVIHTRPPVISTAPPP